MAPAAAPSGTGPEGASPRKPLVYIAGPYTSNPVHNTRQAVLDGISIRDAYDVAVLIPHVTLAADLICPRSADYWYDFDLDQVACCDAVIRLPGESTGADREVAYAEERGIPVFDANVRGFGVWRWNEWTP